MGCEMQDFNFRLSSITLENFRKYEKRQFILDKDMNVFVGKNASGKTSVLEAVCVILGAYLAAFKTYVPSRYVYNIRQNDIRIKFRDGIIQDTLLSSGERQFPCRVACELFFGTNNKEIQYKRILEKAGSRTKFDGSNPMQKTTKKWEAQNASGDDQNIILPIILYLSSSRLWDDGKMSVKYDIPSRYEGYARCLDARRGMQLCTDYLRSMAMIATQENAGKEYPAQSLITDAVNRAFEEEIPQGDKIEFSIRYGEFVQRKPDGSWIPYSELSDGYRNVIRIITEIATRICILNPYLKEKALDYTPGIVVIDELDLSLHPTWQRRIISILKELFPKIQFICATHSPFIIQSLDENELISLDSDVDLEYSKMGIEDIAEDIMGVEMPNYSEERTELYKLSAEYYEAVKNVKAKEDIEQIKMRLEELSAKFSGDPASYAILKQEYLAKKAELERSTDADN